MFRLNPVQTTNKHLPYSNQSTEVGSRCGVLGNSLNLKEPDDCPTHLTIFYGKEHSRAISYIKAQVNKFGQIKIRIRTNFEFWQNSSTSSSPACYQGYSRKELGSENLFLRKLNGWGWLLLWKKTQAEFMNLCLWRKMLVIIFVKWQNISTQTPCMYLYSGIPSVKMSLHIAHRSLNKEIMSNVLPD